MRRQNSGPASVDSYYMYGIHPVISAIANPKRKIDQILCTSEIFKTHKKILGNLQVEITHSKLLDKLLGPSHNHQGIAAKVHSTFSNDLNALTYDTKNYRIAILDQITDPQNIGAIIRSAVAFGIDSLILPQDNAPGENALIAKAACGALEYIKVIQVINLRSTIDYLKKNSFWIIGLDGKSTQLIKDNTSILSGKIAIILGAEDKGLRRLTKESCDFLVKIPIDNKTESLNVSNAASIMFYLASNNK